MLLRLSEHYELCYGLKQAARVWHKTLTDRVEWGKSARGVRVRFRFFEVIKKDKLAALHQFDRYSGQLLSCVIVNDLNKQQGRYGVR